MSILYFLPDETLTSEVESWTTGEQLASWLLQYRYEFSLKNCLPLFIFSLYLLPPWFSFSVCCGSRGVTEAVHGWSVALVTDEGWSEICGSDFVMDLLAEAEAEVLAPPGTPSSSNSDYLFSRLSDR